METRVMPDGLSPSSIDLWLQCPAKFEQEKVLGRRSPGTEATLLGTLAHKVFEVVMAEPAERRTLEHARAVLSDECRAVEETDEWRDLDLDETAAKAFRRQAWHAVAGYWQTEDPQQIDVVALERWVKAEVSGVPLRGIVDRLERDVFGDLCVSDYKTGKVPAPAFRDGKFRQLNLYAAMIAEVDGELPTDGRLLFTTYGKVIGTSIDRQSVEDAVEVATGVWSDLERAEAQHEYEPKPGPLCGWCPFAAECEAGLSELVERFEAGRLKNTAPAWALAAAKAAEA